jgi:MFS family permease
VTTVTLPSSGSALGVLRDPRYRAFWVAMLVSNIGNWMHNLAQGWLMLRTTGSPLLLGLTGFATSLPMFFLILPAGALADRVNRARMLMLAQLAQCAAAAGLALLVWRGQAAVLPILACGALMGTGLAFASPAYYAVLKELLSDGADLDNAIVMNSLQFNIAKVAGPALAGATLSLLGPGWCFLLNALSFVPLIVVLAGRDAPPVASTTRVTVREQLHEWARFIRTTAFVSLLLAIVAAMSTFGHPYQTLMPVVAKALFANDSAGLGLLMMAAGAGAMAGSLFLALRPAEPSWRGILLPLGVFAAMLPLIAAGAHAVLFAAMFVAGAAMLMTLTRTNIFLQRLIPDALRGRILGMYGFAFFAFAPVGDLLCGASAERFGYRTTFVAMAVTLGMTLIVVGWAVRRTDE